MKRRIAVAFLAAVAVFPGTVRAGAPPEIKCAATKQKAASAKEKAKALCYAKAAGAKVPTPVDPACLAKA